MKQTTNTLARLAVTGLMTVGLSGVALADTVDMTTTGPGSNNQATINNSSTTTETNNNTISVVNSNSQTASTGSANVSGNTTAGNAESGDATNNNTTVTTVLVNNDGTGVVAPPVGGNGEGTGAGQGNGVGGSGGSVLGAATGGMGAGVSTLPEVGASVPMDVSALRALYHPTSSTPTAALVNHSRGISALFLGLASLLSLIGAAVSAYYTTRRARQTV